MCVCRMTRIYICIEFSIEFNVTDTNIDFRVLKCVCVCIAVILKGG